MGYSKPFSRLLALTLLSASLAAVAQPAQAEFSNLFGGSRSQPVLLAARGSTLDTMLDMTNRERLKAGLSQLSVDNQLAAAAQRHAEDMARNGKFSHTGSNGSSMRDRIKASGYQMRTAGENIYMQAPRNRPGRVVPGWMNSQGHRDNILNGEFTQVGFGYAQGNGRHYYVQVFGTPMAQAGTTAQVRPAGQTGAVAQTPAPSVSPVPVSQANNQSDTASNVLQLTNKERRQKGLKALSASAQLNAAAQRHAEDMARRGELSHRGSDGSDMGDRIQDSGYRLRMAGENIAYRAPQNDPAGAMQSWMESKGHRDNILNDRFTELGVGYATDGNRHYYVQVFGRPR